MKKLLYLGFLFLISLVSQAGALVSLHPQDKILKIETLIYLYGDDIEIAKDYIVQEVESRINQTWNKHEFHVEINKDSYLVRLKAKLFWIPESQLKSPSTSFPQLANFIRIIPKETEFTSASFILGHSNSGVWLLSQVLGNHTTAAHELGHVLGLDHPQEGVLYTQPRLMLTNYYGVSEELRNPLGMLDLNKRKVTLEEIQELGLESLNYNHLNQAYLGGPYKDPFLFGHQGLPL